MAGLSSARSDQPVQLRRSSLRVGVGLVAGGWLARRLWRGLVVVAATPAAMIGLVLLVGAGALWSVSPLLMRCTAALGVGLLIGCRLVWPDRWLDLAPAPAPFLVAGLADLPAPVAGSDGHRRPNHQLARHPLEPHRPLRDLNAERGSGAGADAARPDRRRLRPRSRTGSARRSAPRPFGSGRCRRGRITSSCGCSPPTRSPSSSNRCPSTPDPLTAGLPVAVAEDGRTWRLQLVGSHVLVVGATGAGKGSVIWSLLLQLAPLVRAGLVSVWAVDPKGGMELAAGRSLFARFAHGDSDTAAGYEATFAEVLEDAVAVMRRRQDRLRGVTRLHEPSTTSRWSCWSSTSWPR